MYIVTSSVVEVSLVDILGRSPEPETKLALYSTNWRQPMAVRAPGAIELEGASRPAQEEVKTSKE